MRALRRFRSSKNKYFFIRTTKTLIRQYGCADRFASSLGEYVRWHIFSCLCAVKECIVQKLHTFVTFCMRSVNLSRLYLSRAMGKGVFEKALGKGVLEKAFPGNLREDLDEPAHLWLLQIVLKNT